MTLQLIQGFDMFATTNDPTVPYLDDDMVGRYLGFRVPYHAPAAGSGSVWFIDSTAAEKGISVQSSVARIDNKALMIERPYEGATYNPQFNGLYHLDFTKTFTSTQKATIGFGVRYSATPVSAFPLLQFLGDDGSESEQCSIWISPTGKLFVGDTSFDITDNTVQTSASLTNASTASGVFRFGRWVYVEVTVDYNGALPVIIIYVNGVSVLSFSAATGKKMSGAFLDAVSIINPINLYWGASNNMTMYIDDVYVSTGEAAIGPQHIVPIWPSATDQAEWVPTSGSAHTILDSLFNPASLSAYVSNDAPTDEDIYTMDDPSSTVVSINAVAPSGFFSIDSGTGTLGLPIHEGATKRSKSISLDSSSPEFKQVIYTANANQDGWTNALVDSMKMGLDLS